MTEHGEGPSPAGEQVTRHVVERVVSTECHGCGGPITYAGTGRRGKYCSPNCRQRAWALRTAERHLKTGNDPRPAVVREVIERETVVRIKPPTITQAYLDARAAAHHAAGAPAVPATGREWARLLAELVDQLGDQAHAVAREHWHHERLYTALVHVVTALGAAHPGGLDQLRSRPGRGRR